MSLQIKVIQFELRQVQPNDFNSIQIQAKSIQPRFNSIEFKAD